MPESKKRPGAGSGRALSKDASPTADARGTGDAAAPRRPAGPAVSPPWLAPTMCAAFIIGVLWISTSYIAGSSIPLMDDLGNWNLGIGFVFIGVGFALSTRWR